MQQGAFGEKEYVPDIQRHLQNQLSWLEVFIIITLTIIIIVFIIIVLIMNLRISIYVIMVQYSSR